MQHSIELAAFRRHSNARATELRTELPVLLGRLVAEVPGSVLELRVNTSNDGSVVAYLSAQAGPRSAELISEAAAVLEPVAEILPGHPDLNSSELMWPLLTSARTALGFQQDDPVPAPSAMWSVAGTRGVPELVELVSPHAATGIRIRMRSVELPGGARPAWDLDFTVLTTAEPPSLRLRAAVRVLYPGLEIAHAPGDAPAVLRVGTDDLPAALAIPIAGEQPIPGTYVGTAAPIPVHPTRITWPAERNTRIGAAVAVSGKHTDVVLGLEERLRHIHVLGRTGTGKSSFLAGMAHEVACSGDGALVLDPHGALVDRIVAELPDHAAARTWVIRCGDVDNPVPLNPMSVDDRVRREIAIDDICATFQYLFDKKSTGIVGPRFRERVAMGLRALAAMYGKKASLLDVPSALGRQLFMKVAADLCGDDRLRDWVKNDQSNTRSQEYAEVVAWVNSKFEAFSSTTAMRAILGSGEDAVDFGSVMDSGRLILVDLSKGDLGESATRLLGYLYLNETWIGALQRQERSRPFTVIVDEAQSMISGSLSSMLSEGRKFGLSVVLAHQYLGQLDEDLLPAVDGNVATTVAFRAAGSDTHALRQRFGDAVDTATLMTLPDLTAVTLRTAAHVTGEPYTLIVDHNRRVTARTGAQLQEFEQKLHEATVNALVEPYREETNAAAAGKSPVQEWSPRQTNDKPEPPKPGPRSDASFLDDWLAKRKSVHAAAEAPDAQGSDEQIEPPAS